MIQGLFFFCVALGWLSGSWWPSDGGRWGEVAVRLLLCAGAYGSTSGIDTREARKHWRLILLAVSVGVIAKAALGGGMFIFLTHIPASFLLATAMAQIDPLLVSALLSRRSSHLSPPGQTILRAWSSFDDPVTVLLTVYAGAWLASLGARGAWGASLWDILANLTLAAAVYLVFRLGKRLSHAPQGALRLLLLLLVFVAGLWRGYILTLGLCGLFLRFSWGPWLDRWVMLSLAGASILLGQQASFGGIFWREGLLLGSVLLISQMALGYLLPSLGGLPLIDRISLAFAQQKGLTAVTLALLIEQKQAGSVAIIAPAVVFMNTAQFALQHYLDQYLGSEEIDRHPKRHTAELMLGGFGVFAIMFLLSRLPLLPACLLVSGAILVRGTQAERPGADGRVSSVT